ncbi:NADPH-dependent FMN reductase [Marinibacterium profundimaris]|uniref:Chromate reductase n=1 Tax=Marinibacterium profundimaris TaxID=1679460 RepID=A0A225NL77_9RHOB|nr:NAD(P)H-dependent oxidoreductase [Marinibacterium profundimaris]OWU74827.1 chromate reductase [Marinibacterium profundimaris]
MPELLFIIGSLREASASRATARAIAARLDGKATCTMADIGQLPHYDADISDNAAVDAFVAQVGAADGVVFLAPEYNYSIPGVLKNAIDWASRPAFESVFRHKPCFVISISGGALGGVRAQAHLKYILNGMLALVHPGREIVVTRASAKVRDGMLEDETILGFIDDEIAGFLGSLG